MTVERPFSKGRTLWEDASLTDVNLLLLDVAQNLLQGPSRHIEAILHHARDPWPVRGTIPRARGVDEDIKSFFVMHAEDRHHQVR